jgi:hypothetical protein
MVYQKNPIVVVGCGGDEAKSKHGPKGIQGLKDGDDDTLTKSQTHLSLPQLNRGVQ